MEEIILHGRGESEEEEARITLRFPILGNMVNGGSTEQDRAL